MTLASFCGCAGRFVSGLVGNSRRHVLSCRGSYVFSFPSRYSALISRWQVFVLDICVGAGSGGRKGQSAHKQSENALWPPMNPIIQSAPRFGHLTQPHILTTFLRQCLRRVVLRKVYSDQVSKGRVVQDGFVQSRVVGYVTLLRTDFLSAEL